MRRLKVKGLDATYHCMTRTVNGEHLFEDREKEVLRKMIWQVADFCGVEVLTYCIMANHFHVLLRVPVVAEVPDKELLRRYKVLYPKPTKYQAASIKVMENELLKDGEEAAVIREKLLARMGDMSEYMKAVKQRFSVWFNRSHERYGTLWAERFKSVLVEGRGNPLQTMAAYIDLNPVRANLVEDPKDYRFCGYAEAVAQTAGSFFGQGSGGHAGMGARRGIRFIWRAYADGALRENLSFDEALQSHRELIFGKRAADPGVPEMSRKKALKVLEEGHGMLPKTTVLRCRVRYFTDGAILGSREFVRGYVGVWQLEKGRKYAPEPKPLRGAEWAGLTTILGLKKKVFS